MTTFSICIPTWKSETFLDRAIDCAQAQTVDDLEIIVAIDDSPDDTIAVARRRAAEDPRIRLIEHSDRLGWARNVNSALDSVRGRFFCLYFHDDEITPDYLERLHAVLDANPEAGAAACGIRVNTPKRTWTLTGESFNEAPTDRMIRFLLGERSGAPLRCLVRRSMYTPRLRLPTASRAGLKAQLAYLCELLGTAPLIQIPDILYEREARRDDGLVVSWTQMQFQDAIRDLICLSSRLEDIFTAYAPAEDRVALMYAAQLALDLSLRKFEPVSQAGTPIPMTHINPAFDALRTDIERLPARFRPGAEAVLSHLDRVVRKRAKSQSHVS